MHTILPGFVATESFSQKALLRRRRSRWLVTDPPTVARAILRSVERNRAEVVVPWFPYRLAIAIHGVAPGLVRASERARELRAQSDSLRGVPRPNNEPAPGVRPAPGPAPVPGRPPRTP